MTRRLYKLAVCMTLMMIHAISVAAQTNVSAPIVRKAPDRPESFGESEYRLGPEDVIQVFVWKEDDLGTTAVIRPDGKISVPYVGEIIASKKTAGELQKELEEKYKQVLVMPVVTVIVKEINYPKVSVLGEVKKPDVYKIKQRATVLDVVAAAGGFTEFAKRNKVVLIRNGPAGQQKFTLNLESMLGGGKEPAFYLQPGDIINVQ